jgi:hypothetical protein
MFAARAMNAAKYQLYCWPEEAASWLGIRFETIAESAYRVDQFYWLTFVNFPAKEPDKSIQSVFLDIFAWTPDSSEDGVARSDFSFSPHEEFEEAKFRRSKMNFPLAAEDTPLDDLQCKVRNAKRVRAQCGVAAVKSADAGQQYREGEWLGEIVVGTGIQTLDNVGNGIACGKHQDRSVLPVLTEPPGNLEPVHPRKHDVEKEQIEGAALSQLQGGAAIGRQAHGVTFLFKSPPEDLRDIFFIFNDENFHLR